MKKVGNKIYLHVSALNQLAPELLDAVKNAQAALPEEYSKGERHFNVIKVSSDRKEVSFLWSPRFDEEDEPAVEYSVHVKDGKATYRHENKENPPIYHGKHLFVNEEYSGFSVQNARARYESWKKVESPLLNQSLIGRRKYWEGIALPEIKRQGVQLI